MERIVTLGAKLLEFQNAHHSLNDYRRLRTPGCQQAQGLPWHWKRSNIIMCGFSKERLESTGNVPPCGTYTICYGEVS